MATMLDAPLHLPLPGIVPESEIDTRVLWCRTCGVWDTPWAPCQCDPDALLSVSDEDQLRRLVEGAFGSVQRIVVPSLFDP